MTHKYFFDWKYFFYGAVMIGCLTTAPATTGASAGAAATPTTFSLEQSVAYGLSHNPLLQGAAIRVEQARMQIKSERGRFLPSLSASYSFSTLQNISATGPADADYVDQAQETASLRLSQTLFAGFEYKNRFERAKLGETYEKARLDIQKRDLTLQITEAFFELLKTRQDGVYISRNIQLLESDLAAARSFSQKQMAPYVHVLRAEADLEESKQQLWQVRTAEKRLSARLKRLLGMHRDTDITTADISFDDQFIAPDFKQIPALTVCIDKALNNRPEMELVRLQRKMSETDSRVSRSRYVPRVSLDVDLYDYDKSYDNFPDSDQTNLYWRAGVNVQWNIFDGGTAYYQSKRERMEMQRLETEGRQLALEIREDVTLYFNTLVETKKRLESVERALAAGRENYDREKKRLQAGIGTTSLVLEALARLARVESRKNQTLLDCRVALAQLTYAVAKRLLSE